MKLLIAGHSVLDHIKEPAGFRFQPGGIFYSAQGLASQKELNDEFFLCTAIEREHYALFCDAYDQFNQQYCNDTDRIPRVHLTIFDEKERCERFENLNFKLQLPGDPLEQFDGILINMITGFEVDENDLREIHQRFSGPVYFDVHSLARGVGDSNIREFRKIPNFIEWAKHITILQANASELRALSPLDDERSIAAELLGAGVKIVLVTNGEYGARAYYHHKKEIVSVFIAAPLLKAKNKVGCGDIFGSYFFYQYIKTNDIQRSLRTAVYAGSCITQYTAFEQYKTLKKSLLELLD
jgi:sugar/nucleoside kinase (ribokinase family)